MLDNNLVFESELESVINEYPNFKIKKTDNISYLKGILDIPDVNNNIIGSFAVEIYPTAEYPYRFPKMFEVGGEIPCSADFHKYQDNSCCITVPAKEILLCKHQITLQRFIKDFAIPYFANQLYKKQFGKYLNEYSHGPFGIHEFYIDLFKATDHRIWYQCLQVAMGKLKFERYNPCYCGSKVKHKKCHLKVENDIRDIGFEQINNDFKLLGL